jgi:hypothetical protein
VDIFPIEKIWIPGVLQAGNFVFLLCQAYWNFIPYVYIIFPIIFWEVGDHRTRTRTRTCTRTRTRSARSYSAHSADVFWCVACTRVCWAERRM